MDEKSCKICGDVYSVIFITTNVQASGDASVTHGNEYTAVLIPDEFYELTGGIEITVGGTKLEEDEYTYENGTVTITSDKVTGKVEITAETVPIETTDTTTTETTTTETTTETTTTETETTTETTTTEPSTTTTVIGYTYEVTGKDQFYFSHDPRTFRAEDLIDVITRYALYSDGTMGEAEVVSDWTTLDIAFNVEGWRNPEEVFETQVLDEEGKVKPDYDYQVCYIGSIPVTIDGQIVETDATAYIAVKGDATLDGMPDAAKILCYAAAKGAGNATYLYSETDTTLEYFAYFLGDATGESKSCGEDGSMLDALDAAAILVYAAQYGADLDPRWEEILDAPLPFYTYKIAEYNGTLPEEKQ